MLTWDCVLPLLAYTVCIIQVEQAVASFALRALASFADPSARAFPAFPSVEGRTGVVAVRTVAA